MTSNFSVELVKDINSGSNSSSPSGFAELNGQLFFSTDDGTTGRELWVTDGTKKGTQLVKDIFPGFSESPSGHVPNSSSPNDLTELNGRLFFGAIDGINGRELWVTDGTEVGTQLLKDIFPGSVTFPSNFTFINSSAPGRFFEFNGQLFFSAIDSINFPGLYVTDGSEDGTRPFKNLSLGTTTSALPPPFQGTKFNGQLFFGANDGTAGNELWVTDGTEAGTRLLKDITPGTLRLGEFAGRPNSSFPRTFTEFNGRLFFAAGGDVSPSSTSGGNEPWVTDGTEAGTRLLKDINPRFTQVLGLRPPDFFLSGSAPSRFTELDERLFFSADDGINGRELWVTDGTEAGTNLFKDINPRGSSLPGGDSISPVIVEVGFTKFDGKLFFSADDGTSGQELWVTDGTEAGTRLVQDINPGSGDSSPNDFTEFDGKLFFSANDGTNGRELWVTDGTEAGTRLVQDINPGSGDSLSLSRGFAGVPTFLPIFTELNGRLFFSANDGTNGEELWVIAPEEEHLVIDFETNSSGNNLNAGDIIQDQFSNFGITVTTQEPGNYPAMIFNSAIPTGEDADLGTPNQDFGGPGIGAGGGANQPGANSQPQGNILIISEDGNSSNPDDNATGGTLIFTFDSPKYVDSLGVLDNDGSEQGSTIKAFDVNHTLIIENPIANFSDNSFQRVEVDAENVSRLEVFLVGSGAVTDLVFGNPSLTQIADGTGAILGAELMG